MAEIVNLRTRRKQAARAANRQKATENAARHGVSRAEKTLEQTRAEKTARDLDGHRREPGED